MIRVRLAVGVAVAGAVVAFSPAGGAMPANAGSTAHYEAIVPPSNDIEFGDHVAGKRIPVPPVVADAIDGQLAKVRAHLGQLAGEPAEKIRLSVRTFRLEAPARRRLYVFEINDDGWARYYSVLVSSNGKAATRALTGVWGYWLDGFATEKPLFLIRRPFIRFSDLDGDGARELVFETYAHNGDMYNAAEDHYFKVGSDLSLTSILVVERIVVVPSLSTDPTGPPILTREIVRDGKNRLRINVYLSQFERRNQRKLVGYYFVSREGSSSPYHFVSQTVLNQKYKGVLVSLSEESPEQYTLQGMIE